MVSFSLRGMEAMPIIRTSAESAPETKTECPKAAPAFQPDRGAQLSPMRMLSPLAALALFAAPLPALACSPVSGYRVPTNLELVGQADMILLATVTGGTHAEAGAEAMRIDIRPDAVLKGDPAAAPTSLAIALATDRYALPSNPYDLAEAHPLSFTGGCYRYMVPKGSRVLFLLRGTKEHWIPAGGPFSRWAEDVLTDDAPWLDAVKFYLEIQRLPEADRKAALEKRRDDLRGKADDFVAHILAEDIDRQLAGPNKPLREDLPPAPED